MNAGNLERENAALRERLARLHEAGLRIAGDLDLDRALQEVLDSARSLTGARPRPSGRAPLATLHG